MKCPPAKQPTNLFAIAVEALAAYYDQASATPPAKPAPGRSDGLTLPTLKMFRLLLRYGLFGYTIFP